MVEGWIKEVDSNGRVHGSCFLIGTPTGRSTHKGIVNVPGGDALYGTEIRKLFIAQPGHKLIGADSSGNQMRASMALYKLCEFGEGLTANTERSLGDNTPLNV